MDDIREKLIEECKRQEESCLYTSTTLYIWLRRARWYNWVLIILPIIFGGISTMSVLQKESYIWVTVTFAQLASIIPAIYKAMDLKVNLDEISRLAAEFKNLQDRFRQAANIDSMREVDCFNNQVETLIEKMEIARGHSITPPEWCFEKAREKIQAGHYNFPGDDGTHATVNPIPSRS